MLDEYQGIVYGGFYSRELGTIESIVPRLNELYNECIIFGVFDDDMFNSKVNEMFFDLKK